jgi:histidinol-phosphatase (PHP family)
MMSNMTSYHTHTVWSDGTATLSAMLAAAGAAGVAEYGVSDHYVLLPSGHDVNWAMPCASLDEYVATVRAAMAEVPFALRLGLEADFFPETIDELRARLAAHPFDYVLGSVHIVDGFPIDAEASYWEPLSEAERNAVWRGYLTRVRQLAESRAFDIAGHLDLPKKFGFPPTVDLSADFAAALDAIAAAGMALELNTAGWDKPAAEAYPAPALLREARRRDIPLVITADAHAPDEVTRHYPRAVALAREAGFTAQARFAGRQRTMVAL